MTSVVIVGSGFTGIECARLLARKLRKHDRAYQLKAVPRFVNR